MFRGFLTDVSNTATNASGFKENIDIHDLYADTHLVWPVGSGTEFIVGPPGEFDVTAGFRF
jgi:hypothetical protein